MRLFPKNGLLPAALVGSLISLGGHSAARADEPKAGDKTEPTEISLLDAMRRGDVEAKAEGLGDGRMSVSVTNRSTKSLKIVLPPGIIASGATGQMGGMGGMGGGGMGGGGMGGMGGGMGGGGMGGGMGGGGMGGGGMGGGGMGGGGMGGGMTNLVMPAPMGMMMLGRLIMVLTPSSGERDTWDMSSLMMGMGGGMGGMGGGMGGMGGGMGGMGGGMGGMGGGMRSVPPTGLPHTTLQPGQTRSLPTRLVSLSPPTEQGGVAFPAKGEKLQLGDVTEGQDARKSAALRRLAELKAPQTVSQMVMWNVGGLDWDSIARITKGWANDHEVALAKQLVASLDSLPAGETGRLLVEFSAKNTDLKAPVGDLSKAFGKDLMILGLKATQGIPARPEGPAVACRVSLVNNKDKKLEAQVQVAYTNAQGNAWVPAGKFTLPVALDKAGKIDAPVFGDALAEGILGRLVDTKLTKGPRVKGKDTYRVQINNYSPLILNGLAIAGSSKDEAALTPKVLAGINLSPRKSLVVPATPEVVESLGLKQGVRVVGADLSGL